MRRSLCLLAMLAAPTAAEAPLPPEGFVETDEGRLEILPPVPATGAIRTPEGFLRLEGPPRQEAGGRPGTFAVRRSPVLAPAGAPPPAAPSPAPAPDATSAADPCDEEREAYARELLRSSGIADIDRPLLLLDALGGPGTARALGYGLLPWPWGGWLPEAPSLRPLAWDSNLRQRAQELIRCAANRR